MGFFSHPPLRKSTFLSTKIFFLIRGTPCSRVLSWAFAALASECLSSAGPSCNFSDYLDTEHFTGSYCSVELLHEIIITHHYQLNGIVAPFCMTYSNWVTVHINVNIFTALYTTSTDCKKRVRSIFICSYAHFRVNKVF